MDMKIIKRRKSIKYIILILLSLCIFNIAVNSLLGYSSYQELELNVLNYPIKRVLVNNNKDFNSSIEIIIEGELSGEAILEIDSGYNFEKYDTLYLGKKVNIKYHSHDFYTDSCKIRLTPIDKNLKGSLKLKYVMR